MGAEQLQSLPVLRKRRGGTTTPRREYGEIVFAVAIVIHVIFMIVTRKKMAVDPASPLALIIMSAPVVALLVARTWRSALIYSLLCTLASSIVMGATIFLFSFIRLVHQKSLITFLTVVGRGFFDCIQNWFQLMSIWWLWLVVAAILRFAYLKLRETFARPS